MIERIHVRTLPVVTGTLCSLPFEVADPLLFEL